MGKETLESLIMDLSKFHFLKQLLSGHIHDSKSIMAQIKFSLNLLKQDLPKREARKMEHLILSIETYIKEKNFFDDFIRSHFFKLDRRNESLLLRDFFDELSSFIKKSSRFRRLELKIVYPPKRTFALISRSELIVIFFNLINTSIAVGSKKITIETRPHGKIKNIDVGNCISIILTDDGAAISEDEKNLLFEPWESTKRNKNGLDLPSSAKMIHRAGGEINMINKTSGGGVVTTIVLPGAQNDR